MLLCSHCIKRIEKVQGIYEMLNVIVVMIEKKILLVVKCFAIMWSPFSIFSSSFLRMSLGELASKVASRGHTEFEVCFTSTPREFPLRSVHEGKSSHNLEEQWIWWKLQLTPYSEPFRMKVFVRILVNTIFSVPSEGKMLANVKILSLLEQWHSLAFSPDLRSILPVHQRVSPLCCQLKFVLHLTFLQ